jgi:hypothetical protein
MDGTADRILKYADREIAALPEAQQESAQREVMRELTKWLEAIRAGQHRPHRNGI